MRCRIFSAAFIMLALLSAVGNCLNFGTYEKNTEAFFSNGTYDFEILVWTNDTDNVKVYIYETQSPGGWTINIDPSSFLMNRSSGTELIVRNGEYVNATLVRVTAIPSYGESGNITISARASEPSEWVGSGQERIFHLRGIHLSDTAGNSSDIGNESQDNAGKTSTTYNRTSQGRRGGPDYGPIFFFIFAIAIIILLVCAAKFLRRES